jgi:hypothetical protein
LDQAEVVKRSLHNHLDAYINGKPARQLGLKIVWLEEKPELALIEQVIRAPRGNAGRLQQALNGYDDNKLAAELGALPTFDGLSLTAALYCRVAIASSAGALNAQDALQMYRRAEAVISNYARKNKLAPKTFWEMLVGMLR